MNWFTLLKQPKLRVGNKVTTNLGSESENEDNDCERKVKEYADKVGNYSQTGSDLLGYSFLDWMSSDLPEEVYCKILNQLNRIQPNDEISEYVEKNGIQYDVETLWYYYPMKDEASFQVNVHSNDYSRFAFYIILDFNNKTAGLSREEALKKVDFR
tara:strand:+ start:1421 stop:1888 length:468 start_codon:yes stop_codon:yes gene_type:complete